MSEINEVLQAQYRCGVCGVQMIGDESIEHFQRYHTKILMKSLTQGIKSSHYLLIQAAETIMKLQDENKRLRDVLAWYVDIGDCEKAANCGERARKALAGEVCEKEG